MNEGEATERICKRSRFIYLIFDVYEQMCGAYTVQILQHDVDREKLVESPHCRIVDHRRRSPPRPD